MSSAKVVPIHRGEHRGRDVTDEALVAACSVGDADALGALYDRHHAQVFRFVARLTRATDEDVDDLVQETFITAARVARHFEGRSSVRTWLLGVAANVARRASRTRARRRALADAAASVEPALRADPEETVRSREFVAAVANAIADLSHPLAVVFVLCDLEEVSGAEAAHALGIPEGTVWRRRHEARKALRNALRGFDD